jgi:hypothetical protein
MLAGGIVDVSDMTVGGIHAKVDDPVSPGLLPEPPADQEGLLHCCHNLDPLADQQILIIVVQFQFCIECEVHIADHTDDDQQAEESGQNGDDAQE